MAVRIIVGAIGLPLLFLTLYVFPSWALPFAISVISIIGVYEMLVATSFVKNKLLLIPTLIFSALVSPWVYFNIPYEFAYPVLFLYIFVLFSVALWNHKSITFGELAGTFFSGIFIPLALSCILRIMKWEYGVYLVLLPFICSWVSDTFAYFAGKFFGKHKLAPTISPKKTIEGSIGGLIGAVLGTVIFVLVCRTWFDYSPSIFPLAIVGLIGGGISQFGDLCFSYIKREFGIKDYGNIFPGHGGVLDRFDSVLFAAPAVEVMLTILHSFSIL